jgi:hypothetical protein
MHAWFVAAFCRVSAGRDQQICFFSFFSQEQGQDRGFFKYLFYRDFAKKYGLPQILQKYIHLQSWPTASGTLRRGPRR